MEDLDRPGHLQVHGRVVGSGCGPVGVDRREGGRVLRLIAALGFRVDPLGDDLAEMRLGDHSFLLQNYFVEAWAANCMMHVMVMNLEAWWEHIASLDLPSHYQVQSPRAPKLEPWGLNTAYVFDPSGVLWHFAQPAS